jgi:hypothetical protein
MSVNFPNSPEDDDIFGGYIYDATKSVWKKLSTIASSSIDDLNDVTITSPANGQALIYDTSIEEWINQTLVEPVLTLEGLSDTNISEPNDGEALVYDSASGQWINETPVSTLEGLSDTTVTAPSDGEVLIYDSLTGKWVNQIPVSDLSGLSDVSIIDPADQQVLIYNTTTSNWVNGDLNLDFSGDFSPRLLEETTTRTTNYTIALSDINKVVPMNGTSLTVSVPLESTTNFPLGSVVSIYNLAATDVTVSGVVGVTVRNSGILPQFGEISLRKRAANEWVVAGGAL